MILCSHAGGLYDVVCVYRFLELGEWRANSGGAHVGIESNLPLGLVDVSQNINPIVLR